LASGSDGGSVLDLGLDLDDMGQGLLLCSVRLRSTVDAAHGHQADDNAQEGEGPVDRRPGDLGDDLAHNDRIDDDECDPGGPGNAAGISHANVSLFDAGFAWKYRLANLLAVAIAIACLAVAAKRQDQTAGYAVCCPTQAGFVDEGQASDCHGN
jgi:hypothetical protein